MSWHESHLRWQALREVEAVLERTPRAPVPWREAYADLFGDRAGLTSFLHYRWTLRLAEPALDDVHRDHPARRLAELGLAVLAEQESDRAVA